MHGSKSASISPMISSLVGVINYLYPLKLTVLIPVFNEAATFPILLKKIIDLPLNGMEKEIIIVDDGSSDGTTEFLKSLPPAPMIRIIFHSKNLGNGAAIRSTLSSITGDIAIIQDADLEYDPQDYMKLIAPIKEGRTNVVYGSRLLNKNNPHGTLPFYLGGKLVTAVTNLLFRVHLTDEPTGYKIFRANFLKNLPMKHNDFCWDVEVTAKVLRWGEKIVEVPISYRPRSKREGKKINYRDGIKTLWTLIYFRFMPSC